VLAVDATEAVEGGHGSGNETRSRPAITFINLGSDRSASSIGRLHLLHSHCLLGSLT
jgi:hypothetical protein